MDAYNLFLALRQFLINSGKGYDIDLITNAFDYASSLHDGQYRKSGEDYIIHPLAVAQICANLGYDTDCICAALLHDVIEDCPDKTNLTELKNKFGESVSSLVDGLTKLKDMRFDTKEEESVQNLRKMFFAMSKDPRVMFVKLCDRLHNMRTISSMPHDKQKTIALETMHVFAPVAHRLGIEKIKTELEDLSLQCLDPIGYYQIKNEIERRFGESRDAIENSQEKIKAQISLNNIKFTEEGRVKSINSIYRKIFMDGKPFDEIYDFYAIRYIVNTISEVYAVLGIVHDLFSYIPEKFKDYISMPKENNYQSVHTTVINEKGVPLEVQIRTKEMHEIAEYGIAAHWKYKSNEEAPEEISKKLMWLRSLVDAEKDINDAEEFLITMKAGLYADEIFVYTPKGDVKALPKGATIIDFAYAIHSAVGNKTVGAKINGIITQIDAVLESGQMIEILTSNSSKGPNRAWLSFVKTGEARNKIRQWFKREKRPENILIGREEIEKIFRKFNRPLTEIRRNDILDNISRREGFVLIDDFYNAIGYGGLSIAKLEFKIREEFDKILKEQNDELIFGIEQVELTPEKVYSDNTIVVVDGMDNCAIKLSKCCNPLPGDTIFGFVTKGHGLSIHKEDCKDFIRLKLSPDNKNRVFSAFWNNISVNNNEEDKSKKNFRALLKISAVNYPELIRRIAETLTDMKVAIHGINEIKTKSDGSIIINALISARDVEHLEYIINKLKTVKNIKEAGRNIGYY